MKKLVLLLLFFISTLFCNAQVVSYNALNGITYSISGYGFSSSSSDPETVAEGVPFKNNVDQFLNTYNYGPADCNGRPYWLGYNGFCGFQMSTDNINWTTFSSYTYQLYQLPTLYQTTYFRRVYDPYHLSNCPVSYSNTIVIKVVPVIGGTIFQEKRVPVCNATDSVSFFQFDKAPYFFRQESIYMPCTYSIQKNVNGQWLDVSYTFNSINNTSRVYKVKGVGVYRRKTVDSIGRVAYSNEIEVKTIGLNAIISPVTQTINAGGSVTKLTASNSSYDYGATYSYSWQKTIDTISGNWSTIVGQTLSTYTPQSANGFYRCLVSTSCGLSMYTPIATVNVIAALPLTGGKISSSNLNVPVNTDAGSLKSDSSAKGGASPYTYSWQKYSNGVWSVVAGAVSDTLNVGILTKSTAFKRKVIDSHGDSVFSNTITFLVAGTTLKAGLIGKSTVLCSGESTTIYDLVAACGGYGSLTYSWEYNIGAGWVAIPSSNSANLSINNITVNTKYRRKTVDEAGNFVYCNEVEILVYPALDGGTIAPATQTICSNIASFIPEELSFTDSSRYTNGTVTYQWQKSTSATGPWADISGVTGTTYRPKISTQVMYYRVVVTSSNCNMTSNSSVATVLVNNACRVLNTKPSKK